MYIIIVVRGTQPPCESLSCGQGSRVHVRRPSVLGSDTASERRVFEGVRFQDRGSEDRLGDGKGGAGFTRRGLRSDRQGSKAQRFYSSAPGSRR